MHADYVDSGATIDHTPSADIAAGEVLVFEDMVTVARDTIETGKQGSLAAVGTFAFRKSAGEAIAKGKVVFWNVADQVATADDGGGAHKRIGPATAAAADGDERVRARLGG